MKDSISLYHVTERASLEQIEATGLHARTCFGNIDMIDYYAEDMSDPVILRFDFAGTEDDFEKLFMPDMHSIEEPITTCLDYHSEDDVLEAWDESDGTAMDCLRIAKAVRCRKIVSFADLVTEEWRGEDSPRP